MSDGTNTPRQLSDLSGEITLTSRYTPWGDTLDTYGTGNFTFGYFGGVMDAATGLLYVGNGQYYDPATSRFLTRNVNPNSTNPYAPWNPIGAIVGPIGLIALFSGRKKKGSKAGTFLVLLLVMITVGMTIAGCGGQQQTPTPNVVAVPLGTDNYVIVSDGTVIGTATAQVTPGAPNITVTATVVGTSCATVPPTPTPSPTSTPTPSGPTKLDEKMLSAFGRGITTINGLDFYNWYREKLYPQTSEWWWARFGYDGDGFTITDAFAVVYVFETQNNWSNQYIPEASVRAANEWCKDSRIYDRPCGSKEEYVNWFAAYYESAGNYVAHPEMLTSAYKNYKDAMGAADFKAVIDNGASLFSHPNSWNSGCNAAQDKPCGWANPSTYSSQGRGDLALKMLSTDEKYFFTKNPPNDPDPWIIPSGCINIKWVVHNWLNEICPPVR